MARGVVDGVKSSKSAFVLPSRGVIGRSIPGMYPGSLGPGEDVAGRGYGDGEER